MLLLKYLRRQTHIRPWGFWPKPPKICSRRRGEVDQVPRLPDSAAALGNQFQALFALAERVIVQVELSAESVRYYASLVEFYTVYKLKRMDREAAHLYLLCFVHDRYQRLNDNLLGAFCSLVRRYVEAVVRDRYEFMVYRQLRDGLEAGDLHCRDSARFRSFDSEEANIERILLSLALKSTTQSVIVGKLSAYRRKNRTKRALWELDGIIRTLYLLDYIDSPVLRRNVQNASAGLSPRNELQTANPRRVRFSA